MNLYLGIALLLALTAAGLGWNNYLDEREAFNTFKGVQTALAEQQEIKNARETRKHDDDIKTAIASRDAALKRLRARAEHPDTNRVSPVPPAPEGTSILCFNRAKLDDAIRAFTGGVGDLIREGEVAVIDDRAWLSAWPK